MKVLVTGASGFVGSHLVPALAGAGMEVRRAGRRPTDGDTVAVGDVGDPTAWGPAMRGVEAVVHLAGRAHVLQDDDADPAAAYHHANVDVTAAAVAAAVSAGVERFVFLSSIKALGEGTSQPYVEEDAPAPQDDYGRTKLAAEQVVMGATGITATVLRPPLVYGPGVRANFLRLLDAVERGLPLPLGAARARRSMLYVGNLSDAVLAVLGSGSPQGLFHVADDEAADVAELVRALARAAGKRPRLVPVPVPLLRAAAAVVRRSAEVDRLVSPLVVSNDRMRGHFGWSPPHSLHVGLRETVRWYRGTM